MSQKSTQENKKTLRDLIRDRPLCWGRVLQAEGDGEASQIHSAKPQVGRRKPLERVQRRKENAPGLDPGTRTWRASRSP